MQHQKKQNYTKETNYSMLPVVETQDKLLKLMIKLGDSANLKTNVANFSKVLNSDKPELDKIASVMWACITQLPSKTFVYTILLAHLNPSIVSGVLLRIGSYFDKALDSSSWANVKLCVRFYAELVKAKVILHTELFTLYSLLLEHKIDAYIYVLIASLPFVGKMLHSVDEAALDNMMNAIEEYMSSRQPSNLKILLIHHTAITPDDELASLWKIVKKMKQDGWAGDVLLKTDMTEDHIAASLEQSLRSPIFSSDSLEKRYPFQGPIFPVFTLENKDQFGHLVPPFESPARYIISDIVKDILTIYSHNHKECVLYLCRLQFNVEKATIFQIIMEVIIGELLRLPKSSEKSIYYAVVVVGMCRADATFPSALGKCMRILFARMDEEGGMDCECVRRLCEWFAIHLSNYKYGWKWSEWEYALDLSRSSLRHGFLAQLVDCCTRLSYPDHIRSILPPAYTSSNIWDSEGPRINYIFTDCEEGLSKIVAKLCESFKHKDSADAIEASLGELKAWTASASDLSLFLYRDESGIAMEVFIQCMMQVGSKSFSHLLNAFERNLPSIQRLMSMDGQRCVALICNTWKTNPQFFEICIDKLTNYRVLDAKSVILWICMQIAFDYTYGGGDEDVIMSGGGGEDVREEVYFKAEYWTILSSTLSKVNLRVTMARAKVEAARGADSMIEDGISNELTKAEHGQKEVFIYVCTMFADMITQKAAAMDAAGVDIITSDWWKWVSGGLFEILRKFQAEIARVKFTLTETVFTINRDARVLDLWNEAVKMYERRIAAA